jgi:GNAT superfamily N-acetyltransferase
VIRQARTDDDLAAYAALWSAVRPRDAVSAEFVRGKLAREPERLYLLAEHEGETIGCGIAAGSGYVGRTFVAVAVAPEHRRQGLGTDLLDRCLEHARSLGGESAVGQGREDDHGALAFAGHHGFVEVERGVEYELELLSLQPLPPSPEGIEIVELAAEHHPGAYEIWIEGTSDAPSSDAPAPMSFERWLEETIAKELVLIALDGEEVVGFAALEDRDRDAGLAGNDLTTTRRSHRRRGIAEALKRRQLAWAAEHGYRTVVTDQDEANLGMQRLNEKLGYRRLPGTVLLRRSLRE